MVKIWVNFYEVFFFKSYSISYTLFSIIFYCTKVEIFLEKVQIRETGFKLAMEKSKFFGMSLIQQNRYYKGYIIYPH